jgi:hypothetical protein
MRGLLVFLGTLALVGVAFAGNPPDENVTFHERISCDLQSICYDWNFADGDHGFVSAPCDPGGGLAVWAHGATTIPGAPGTVWGTVLTSDYPSEAGEGICSPAFTVDACCYLMEIYHYYDIETNYDGCNVTVNDVVVPPIGGYDATISTSTSFYAWCVDLEEGFTGHDATWGWDCFDLGEFMGQEVVVCFDFGSDNSVTYPGWYIAQVRVGSDAPSPVEGETWGQIKGMFK